MMSCNDAMKALIGQAQQLSTIDISVDLADLGRFLVPSMHLERNCRGEPYICVENFCGLDISEPTTSTGRALTDLEWDGNELYVDIGDAGTVVALAQIVSLAMRSWTHIVSAMFPTVDVDIIASIDDGSLRDDGIPSATIRLYSVRGDYHIVGSAEGFDQPVCIQQLTNARYQRGGLSELHGRVKFAEGYDHKSLRIGKAIQNEN